MDLKTVDELLESISSNLNGGPNKETAIRAINEFQADPLQLDRKLKHFIKDLTKDFFGSSDKEQCDIGELFYNFSKVCGWKKSMRQLECDIYMLPQLLRHLSINDTKSSSWHLNFLLLVWINLLIMSPFKLENDEEVYKLTSGFKNSLSLKPIVCSIHAELFIRNIQLFQWYVTDKAMDLETMNLTLKLLVVKNNDVQLAFFDLPLLQRVLNMITSSDITNEEQGILSFKILPKLCRMLAARDEWDTIEDVISFFLRHLGLSFTELRFKLARNLGKIATIIHSYDPELAGDFVSTIVSEVTQVLSHQILESIDADSLHSYLLILAEFARFKLLRVEQLEIIGKEIVPHTIFFQQMRISNVQGHHIRDATNFICWSVARNMTDIPDDINLSLLLHLLMNSMSDFELIIRRSSNAALQELLGRHGSRVLQYPVIIKLIEMSVTNINRCFMENIPTIYNILKDTAGCSQFICNWLVNYTINKNHYFQVVKLACATFNIIYRSGDSKQKLECDETIKELGNIASQNNSTISRLLYLFTSLPSTEHTQENKELAILCFSELTQKELNKSGSAAESFEILSFLKFLVYMPEQRISVSVVNRLFQALRKIEESDAEFPEFSNLFNQLVKRASEDDQTFFSEEAKDLFWKTFYKYIKYNHTLSCSALPHTSTPVFVKSFYVLVPQMDSFTKSRLLNSMSEMLENLGDNDLLFDLVSLLDDYTVTEQGDVGRLVRTGVVKLIKNNLPLFTKDERLMKETFMRLLRLIGEQQDELRLASFEILTKKFNYIPDEEAPFNAQILNFYNCHFNGNREFWRGYLISAGAIHSTDKQIVSAIDEFLRFYGKLENEHKLSLLNELVRIIPSAKEIRERNGNYVERNSMGAPGRDIIKVTAVMLTFWLRILESGIYIPHSFNYEGVFAKFYNLQLGKAGQRLRMPVFNIMPLLSLSKHRYSKDKESSIKFTNNIIKTLWKLGKPHSSNQTQLQTIALESILKIHLGHGKLDLAKMLEARRVAVGSEYLSTINDTDMLLT